MAKKIAIVVGNEHKGVSLEAAELADGIIQIPMFGMIQSLNVSVATAVILFEAVRQRITAGHYDKSKLADAEFMKLLKVWALKESALLCAILFLLFLLIDSPVTIFGWILSLGIEAFLVYIIHQIIIILINPKLKIE